MLRVAAEFGAPEKRKALEPKGYVPALAVPPRGLETADATRFPNNDLGQSPFLSGAESGAVAAEVARLTPKALAAALMGLPPADRARLAAVLLGQQTGQVEGTS
jgi:hypothetical protein